MEINRTTCVVGAAATRRKQPVDDVSNRASNFGVLTSGPLLDVFDAGRAGHDVRETACAAGAVCVLREMDAPTRPSAATARLKNGDREGTKRPTSQKLWTVWRFRLRVLNRLPAIVQFPTRVCRTRARYLQQVAVQFFALRSASGRALLRQLRGGTVAEFKSRRPDYFR